MKNYLLLLLLLLVRNVIFGQIAVIADPALAAGSVNTMLNQQANPLEMPQGQVFILKVPVFNYHLLNGLPAGSCKLKIGLGSKLVLQDAFNISSLAYNNYFNWTMENSGGQVFITGNLNNPMPAAFSGIIEVPVMGNLLGQSSITANFLVTNHNNAVLLSDENGSNNGFLISYIVVQSTVPVTFTYLHAQVKNCLLKASFGIENEVDVNKYELQVSTTGIDFESVATIQAANLSGYHFSVQLNSRHISENLVIRVMSVDNDGKKQYSNYARVNAQCGNEQAFFILYPNPVSKSGPLMIKKSSGMLNGIYRMIVYDMAGKKIYDAMPAANNNILIWTDCGRLAAGKYLVQVIETLTGNMQTLPFEKL